VAPNVGGSRRLKRPAGAAPPSSAAMAEVLAAILPAMPKTVQVGGRQRGYEWLVTYSGVFQIGLGYPGLVAA